MAAVYPEVKAEEDCTVSLPGFTGIRLQYEKFESYTKRVSTGRLKVFELIDSTNHWALAADLVREFDAEVWRVSWAECAKFDSRNVSNEMQAKYIRAFIEHKMGGDCGLAIAHCAQGEALARAAAGSNAIKLLVMMSVPAVPNCDPCEADLANEVTQYCEWLENQFSEATGEAVPMPDFRSMHRKWLSQSFQANAPVLESMESTREAFVLKLWNRVLKPLSVDVRHYQLDAQNEEFSPFWAHWDTVKQPTILFGGADDSFSRKAIEHAACLLPNVQLELLAAGSHLAHMEDPGWTRKLLFSFMKKHGLE